MPPELPPLEDAFVADVPAADIAAEVIADPTLGPLLRRFTSDGRSLIRQEVSLASLEIRQSAITIAKESAVVALGGVLIVVGLVVLLVFVILAVGRILGGAYWLSTLLIGGILVVAGALALHLGRRAIRRNAVTPRRTIESLRETREWAEKATSRFTR